jgi:hypothetical protein
MYRRDGGRGVSGGVLFGIVDMFYLGMKRLIRGFIVHYFESIGSIFLAA